MKLGMVVPCYNEEEVLPETARRLLALHSGLVSDGRIDADSKIFSVDEGSNDRTWSIIEELSQQHANIAGIKLARNCGHQHALLAGLYTADGAALVSIDADLQDDISVIETMVEDFHNGVHIVYGVRKQWDSVSSLKRVTAQTFYRLMKLLGAESIYNHADYSVVKPVPAKESACGIYEVKRRRGVVIGCHATPQSRYFECGPGNEKMTQSAMRYAVT